MSVDITAPQDLWGEALEGVVLTWIYQDGSIVEQGQVIGELMVEKAQLELVAPASGRLKILAPAEMVFNRTAVLGVIEPV
jgi:pyruvate/2-oxoglutarate dehydrogenase complex dihydrolipoamide acyltransferase (E2) component